MKSEAACSASSKTKEVVWNIGRIRTFAMVGASTHWKRPSSYAMKYLMKKGYRVIPINPARVGDEILPRMPRNNSSE